MIPSKLNFFKYQSTLPVDVLDSAIVDADKRYQINRQKKSLLDVAFANMGGSPAEQEYINTVKGKVQATVNDITKDTQGNTRWDMADRDIDELTDTVASDKYLTTIQQNYKAYQEELSSITDMRKKGQEPLVFSDYSQHKSWDEKGNTKLYQSHVEPKGEYVGRMFELWKAVSPNITESGLTPYEMNDIFLYNKTVKGISKQDILDKLPQVKSLYLGDIVGQQHVRKLTQLDSKDDPKYLDKNVADKEIENLLLNTGLLGTYQQTTLGFQQNPQKMLEMQMEEKLKLEQAKAKMKADAKNKYAGEENSGLIKTDTGYRNNTTGKSSVISTINQAGIQDQLSNNATFDFSSIKLIDSSDPKMNESSGEWEKRKKTFSTEKIKVVGFNALNTTGDPKYDGAYIANVTDDKGSYRVLLPAPDYIRQSYSFINDLDRAYDKLPASTPVGMSSKTIVDNSGLLGVDLPTDVPVGMQIKKDKDGAYQYIPVWQNSDGKWMGFTYAQKEKWGVRTQYTKEQLIEMANDKVANDKEFRTMVKTNAKVAE